MSQNGTFSLGGNPDRKPTGDTGNLIEYLFQEIDMTVSTINTGSQSPFKEFYQSQKENINVPTYIEGNTTQHYRFTIDKNDANIKD